MPDKALMMREFNSINLELQQVKQKRCEVIEDLVKVLRDHKALEHKPNWTASKSADELPDSLKNML